LSLERKRPFDHEPAKRSPAAETARALMFEAVRPWFINFQVLP